MSSRHKVVIGIVVVLVLGSAAGLAVIQGRDRGVEVRMEEVGSRDLVATVTASGNVRARRTVDISSDVPGRVVELNVDEGDDVEEGFVLLRIDPTQYEAQVARNEGALSAAKARVLEQEANVVRARRDYDRIRSLSERDSLLVSAQQVQDAQTALEVAQAQLQSLEFGVAQSEAALAETREYLRKTVIRAPISGKVTRLNIELGETVVVGTMNNPGSLILTISDLSVVEAVMEVDETDVPLIALGDSALVELDAFPDRQFSGRVTEIGNSAIRPPASTSAAGGQAQAIDFEVVITLTDPPESARPDLSATADVVIDVREDALAVPIIAVTVRDEEARAPSNEDEERDETARRQQGPVARSRMEGAVEGVFVVRGSTVTFTEVEIGITGQEYFEVLSGVEEGDTVVAGPYQRIRNLNDGDAVRSLEEEGDRRNRRDSD
jgi:HlyD family secretion protein